MSGVQGSAVLPLLPAEVPALPALPGPGPGLHHHPPRLLPRPGGPDDPGRDHSLAEYRHHDCLPPVPVRAAARAGGAGGAVLLPWALLLKNVLPSLCKHQGMALDRIQLKL